MSSLEAADAHADIDLDQPHVMSLRLDKMGAISPLSVVSNFISDILYVIFMTKIK